MEEKKNLWSSYDEAAKKELHEIMKSTKPAWMPERQSVNAVKLAVEMAKEARISGYQRGSERRKEPESRR